MCRLLRLAVLALVAILGTNAVQVQEKDDGIPQMLSINELPEQIRGLQKNVSDLWTYIFELRKAMSVHLTHLRQHQIELEQSVRKMSHHGSSHSGHEEVHGHDHHGEDHTGHSDSEAHHDHHGDDHHGHSDASHDHGHTDSNHDHGHSDSSHDHGHTESSHDHGHSDSEHSHSDSDHGHSESDHGHSDSGHDHGHSDSGHDHGHEDDHHHHDHSNEHHSSHEQGSHHTHHGDSHEKTDSKEQTQQQEVAEKVVMATHVHHHHDHAKPEGVEKKDPLQLFHGEHHHHHHSHGGYSRNRTTLPKYSEYNLYDFAVCEVQANRAIAPELQQDVRGQVSLWQRKTGGPLSIHLRLQGFKIGDHHGQHGMQQTTQEDNEAPVHAGGHRHGFHVHTNGDLSNGCQSTGPHFNPAGVNHGGPTAIVRHVGDLGNIACDEHGVTNIVFNDNVVSLSGQYSILGKSMVIHANEDDYGLKENDLESTKTGNAGTRIACCVIEKVEKLPLKAYKAIKQATQHQNR